MRARAQAPPLPRAVRLLMPVLVFSAFLTQTKFIPGLENNIGPFEVLGAALIVYYFLVLHGRAPAQAHPLVLFSGGLLAVAVVSQINLPWTHRANGLVNVAILLFMALLFLVLNSLAVNYRLSPTYFLRLITYAALVAGPWVVVHGLRSEGDVQAAGPFRNRAHMANYMLTAFWLVLVYALAPNLSKRQRWAAYGALLPALYAVAVAGRRSVYLALVLGLMALGGGLLLARRSKRIKILAAGGAALAFLSAFYFIGPDYLVQAKFFRARFGEITTRISQVFTKEDEAVGEEANFFVMQRQGVLQAFREHPVLGIGWGGFVESRYSPTGHEVHSTPLRFLAETGLLGLALYLSFLASLLLSVTGQYRRLRNTAYATSWLALTAGVWSLAVSYIYNRHVTERTFWLLVAVVLAAEPFSRVMARAAARPAEKPAVRTRPRAVPAAAGSGAPARLRLHRPSP